MIPTSAASKIPKSTYTHTQREVSSRLDPKPWVHAHCKIPVHFRPKKDLFSFQTLMSVLSFLLRPYQLPNIFATKFDHSQSHPPAHHHPLDALYD